MFQSVGFEKTEEEWCDVSAVVQSVRNSGFKIFCSKRQQAADNVRSFIDHPSVCGLSVVSDEVSGYKFF